MAQGDNYKQKLRNHSNNNPQSPLGKEGTEEEDDQAPIEYNTEGESENTTNISSTGKKKDKNTCVEVPVINMDDFKNVDNTEKLDLLMAAINKINTNFHYKFDDLKTQMTEDKVGIKPKLTSLTKLSEEMCARLDDCESQTSQIQGLKNRIDALERENQRLNDEVTILKGISQVHDKTISNNQKKFVDLTTRSMANNVVITGLLGDTKEEDPRSKVLAFIREKLKIAIDDSDVIVAHRMGSTRDPKKEGAKVRPMVVRCSHALRSKIFGFTKNLKDVQNEKGESYYVYAKLPEPLHTEKNSPVRAEVV